MRVFEKLPPEVQQIIGSAGFLATACLSRLLWHHWLVQHGKRRFWSRELAWEFPTAILSAIMGGGFASYLGLDALATHAMVGFASYLGPRGIEVIVTRLADRFAATRREGDS